MSRRQHSQWPRTRLKYLADFQAGDHITADSIRESGEYPVYGGNGLRGYTDAFVHEGDVVLVGRQGALCGNVNYATGHFWASEHAVVVTPRPGVHVRWLGEVLRSMDLRQYSMSAAQPGLSVEFVTNLETRRPPYETQHRIARYLDAETSEIDGLIAEKERMLSLLEEKRSALVTHAVTHGLDPNAPLKPSGLEWLGEIPEHWRILHLKRTWASSEYGISDSIRDEGDVRVLRMSCITKDGLIDLNNAGQANLSASRYGDIHIPLPSPSEQSAIVEYISTVVGRSQTLEHSLFESIKLLKERRSALITAAVTGQIPEKELGSGRGR